MQPNDDFTGLICRVRAGEPDAVAELFRRYEPEVRRAVHMRLTDPGLRRILDSVDVCQSVFAAFYVHLAGGALELNEPADLVRVLVRMARNRVVDHYRRLCGPRRGQRLPHDGGAALETVADVAPGPVEAVANRELLQQVYARLSPDDRYLAEQRAVNRPWAELGRELHQSPDALRVRLRRALTEVCKTLGLGDDRDE
jgi:RNA polymerase sigma-70 factor (ECF subfamily)